MSLKITLMVVDFSRNLDFFMLDCCMKVSGILWCSYDGCPVDNFGTVVGENPTPYGILAFRAVNGLSIVWVTENNIKVRRYIWC